MRLWPATYRIDTPSLLDIARDLSRPAGTGGTVKNLVRTFGICQDTGLYGAKASAGFIFVDVDKGAHQIFNLDARNESER